MEVKLSKCDEQSIEWSELDKEEDENTGPVRCGKSRDNRNDEGSISKERELQRSRDKTGFPAVNDLPEEEVTGRKGRSIKRPT